MDERHMQVNKILQTGPLLAVIIVASMFMLFYRPVLLGGDIQYFVVLSGSMQPTIPVGSVIAAKPVDFTELKEEDVICFETVSSGPKVTHRIIAVTEEGFITKGDANDDADEFIVKKENIVGNVVLIIPYLGHVSYFVKTPVGFALLVIIPAVFIIMKEIRSIIKYRKTDRLRRGNNSHAGKKRKIESKILAMLLVFLLAATLLSQTGVVAWFTDLEVSRDNYITAWITILGDIDGDGDVDHNDLLLLASAYGSEVGDPNYIPEADIDGSGKVDHKDLLILAANYGKGT